MAQQPQQSLQPLANDAVVCIQCHWRMILARKVMRQRQELRKRFAVTSCLLNCGAAQDAKPIVRSYSIGDNRYHVVVVADGHAGNRVTRAINALPEQWYRQIVEFGPKVCIDKLKMNFKNNHAGAMIIVALIAEKANGQYKFTISWRGDAPFWVYSEGSELVWCKPIITPCQMPDPVELEKMGVRIHQTDQPYWCIMPDDTVAMSDQYTQIYFECADSGRKLADYRVLGDSGSFLKIPTQEHTFTCDGPCRFVTGSDGFSDVIHPQSLFMASANLTARKLVIEAHLRWTTTEKTVVSLERTGEYIDTCTKLGLDDISVVVGYLS